jgi:hypothetical protein
MNTKNTGWDTTISIEMVNDKVRRLEQELLLAKKQAATIAIFEQEAEKVRSIWEPRGYVLVRRECLPSPAMKALPPARQERLSLLCDGVKRPGAQGYVIKQQVVNAVMMLPVWNNGQAVNRDRLIACTGYTDKHRKSHVSLIFRGLEERGLVRRVGHGSYVKA